MPGLDAPVENHALFSSPAAACCLAGSRTPAREPRDRHGLRDEVIGRSLVTCQETDKHPLNHLLGGPLNRIVARIRTSLHEHGVRDR
jgi:hypothetical protein